MRQTRSRIPVLAMLVLLAVLLSACGGEESQSTSEKGADSATRVVEGAYGEIEIPSDPQRIFADLMTVDYLTALGYDTSKIIGVFDASSFAKEDGHYLHDFFAGRDLVDPGFQYEMNLEQIAAARPDLILLPFDQIDGAEQQDELGKIAPLLVVPIGAPRESGERYGGNASFQDWRGTLRAYGELLDLQDEAEDYISETEAQLDDIRQEHGDLIDETTVTEAKSTPDYMAINVLSEAKTSGVLGTILLSELGFQAPPQQAAVKADEYGGIDLSNENLDLVDGDLLFLEVREGSTVHEESPIWPTLDVVENDAVFVVGNHWEFGGAVAAREVIADIDDALTELAGRP